ncbi:MAG: fibronectin type III domain-containing protein [Candidatus Doudnabacteria bacterium]|nr:fibronectin type III domain-containing protein [Candidatus Doudnabacteria bacterium]
MSPKSMLKSMFRGLLIFAAFYVMFGAASAAKAATLAVSPTGNTVTVGSNFTVNIVLDTAGQAAAGVDIYSLHFNPVVLQVVDSDAVTAGVQISAGTLMPTNQYNTVDNSNGVIQFSQISSTSGTNFTGNGTLASVTFTAIAAGTSGLTFDFTLGSTTDCNVAVLYSDALTGVTNGSYVVNPAADVTPPSTPTNLIASTTSSTAINLTWTASTDNVAVAGYQVFRCSGTACTPTVQVATSTTNSFANSGLAASTTYVYRLKAYDAAGNISGFSPTATATTAAPPAPVISAIVVSSITQTGATVTWTTDVPSDSQVDYGPTNTYGSSSVLNSSLVTSHSVTLSGLSAGTLYHYRVDSKNSQGTLANSPDNTFTTQSAPDTTAPTVTITNPSVSGQNVSGTTTLSATASDPTVAGQVTSGLFSMTILLDGSVYATSSSGSLSANLDTSALTNATHTITATARDNAGNIGNSSAVTIVVFNLGNATRYPRKISLSGLEDLASVPASAQVIATIISPANGSTLETQTISADASHDYTVTFLSTDPQTVNIRVRVNGYLSQLLTSIDSTVNSAAVISVPQLPAGDFNNDNTVNALDYSLMNTHWNQNYATADINADGLINSLDFAVLKNNFNKSGS